MRDTNPGRTESALGRTEAEPTAPGASLDSRRGRRRRDLDHLRAPSARASVAHHVGRSLPGTARRRGDVDGPRHDSRRDAPEALERVDHLRGVFRRRRERRRKHGPHRRQSVPGPGRTVHQRNGGLVRRVCGIRIGRSCNLVPDDPRRRHGRPERTVQYRDCSGHSNSHEPGSPGHRGRDRSSHEPVDDAPSLLQLYGLLPKRPRQRWGLDSVGIFQALARWNEKLGRLKDAGTWRQRAGQGYLALLDAEMARDERQYLALVEYRNAVQDLHGDPSLPAIAKEYAAVLKDNFSGGAEGLTHEGLFAGAFFRTLGDHLTAAKYFFDTAEAMSEQATTGGDPLLREATILAYERAMDSATKAGRADVARVAQMRAYDLKQMK